MQNFFSSVVSFEDFLRVRLLLREEDVKGISRGTEGLCVVHVEF